MNIVYAVISYDSKTDKDINIVGWSTNKPEARELESLMNDTAELLFGDNESLVSYCTIDMLSYGAATEYEPYGPFNGILCRDKFIAIIPEGQAEHYGYLSENTYPINCANLLKGLE